MDSLKGDAAKGVKRIDGIAGVVNRIEVLPVSTADDELRWALYRSLYCTPSLSHYGTRLDRSAGVRPRYSGWGGRATPRDRGWAGTPFNGMEPVGNHPIHIIVRYGHVTLIGAVESHADRSLAGLKASSLQGVFKVTNGLWVVPPEE